MTDVRNHANLVWSIAALLRGDQLNRAFVDAAQQSASALVDVRHEIEVLGGR
jgi:hypothetical protein